MHLGKISLVNKTTGEFDAARRIAQICFGGHLHEAIVSFDFMYLRALPSELI